MFDDRGRSARETTVPVSRRLVQRFSPKRSSALCKSCDRQAAWPDPQAQQSPMTAALEVVAMCAKGLRTKDDKCAGPGVTR